MTGSLQAAAGGGDPPAGLRPSNGDRYGHGGGEASAVPTSAGGEASAVLTLADTGVDALRDLLATQALQLVLVDDGAPIPGSYWGEPEAGLIGSTVYVRADTPVHSALHEACHLIVQPPERRAAVHTDATDSVAEEDATCYLQIVLAARLPGVGSDRLMRDMDTWGYTYRLGSTRAWFEHDAEDARAWLGERGLLPAA
ncbi:hypothetical protein ACFJIW_20000 [Tahibacter sp. UC22_41]|uniref:hypothetical protein n=1 Tax=Tahibacter sp. UC22_41 TaxID=3350178 RepID=UPI0036DB061A